MPALGFEISLLDDLGLFSVLKAPFRAGRPQLSAAFVLAGEGSEPEGRGDFIAACHST